jgi:hypothetical protein
MARMEVSFGLLITPPSSQARERERERVSDLNLLSKLPLSLSYNPASAARGEERERGFLWLLITTTIVRES